MVRFSGRGFALLLPLVALAGCEPQLPSEPDIADGRESIVGGTLDHGDPAVALIVYADSQGAYVCTGTLIAEDAILTAGHCVVRDAMCNSPWNPSACEANPASSYYIFGGTDVLDADTWELRNPTWRASVTSVHPHPYYGTDNSGAPVHDVAVLRITDLEVFSGSKPEPMAWLSTPADSAFTPGSTFKAVGYGITNGSTGAGTGTKRMVTLTIHGWDDAAFWYGGFPGNTCSGDSGGPAIKMIGGVPTVIGTTSYGDQNCTQTGVNMRTDHERAFISQFAEPVSEPEPPPSGGWSGSSAPDAAIPDDDYVCRSLDVEAAGDAADVRLDLSGTHTWRSILRATLSHDGVTREAFAVGTFDDGAGSFSLSDVPVDGFDGSASGTWTLCIEDTDDYGDSGTLDYWRVHD